MEHHSQVADLVVGISMLLLLASATLLLARKIRLPFTVLLVIAGVALRQLASTLPPGMGRLLDIHISPDIIFYVFLPSLIFESASHLDVRQLRDNLAPVLTLAVPGLLISTGMIAGLVSALTDVPFPAALVLGAILSATDPVAVIALFHQLGAPQRLTVLVEGESLFNDATAIVAAKILLAVALAGFFTPATVGNAVIEFFVVFIGGIAVGWLMAVAAGIVLGAIHENQAIEISILTTLAYLSFLIGEEVFHVSGVMATVAAGLTMGGSGRSKISPGIADYIEQFWAYVAFVANALIFLLVGLAIDMQALALFADILLVAVVAMLISRALVIYALVPAVGRLPGAEPVGRAYQTVLYWGGLRGAVALAVVMSLGDFEWARAFTAVVMGAVLFTLIVQGLTIEPLMRWLGLDQPTVGDRLALDEARVEAALKAVARIPELGAGGLFSAAIAARLKQENLGEIARLREAISELQAFEVDDDQAQRMLWLRCLVTERIAYYDLFSRHHIDERTYRALDHDANQRIDDLRHYGLSETILAGNTARGAEYSLANLARRIPGSLGRLLHTRGVAHNYVRTWGEFQALERVIDSLRELRQAEAVSATLFETVTSAYERRAGSARVQLDEWAAQFPEFVIAMQERLAARLLLRVERDSIAERMHNALLPHGMGDDLLEEIDARIRRLGAVSYEALEVSPAELLRKVPFFSALDAADVEQIAKHLQPLAVAPGERVIREGESGTTMYFIARGVMRVVHDVEGAEQELATLFAGDFFGEMALLDDAPRSATCRAATACALHELGRSGVAAATELCPALGESLREAAQARRAAQQP